MAMITYLVIKIVAIAHDQEWLQLISGWGLYYLFELFLGTIVPLIIFAYGVRHRRVTMLRWGALLAVRRKTMHVGRDGRDVVMDVGEIVLGADRGSRFFITPHCPPCTLPACSFRLQHCHERLSSYKNEKMNHKT